MTRASLLSFAVLLFAASTVTAQVSEDWADSPEAYFLTSKEKTEWFGLRSQPERDAFKDRYWLRRDPTPGTAANEFRDLVASRIKIADERFRMGEIDGSRTARGLAFVVFGSPARVAEAPVTRPGSYPATRSNNPPRVPMGSNDGLETVVQWKYERDRTPKILQMLGRPSLEIIFYLEPERKRDRFEIERLAKDLQQVVSEKSIVNPDLVAGPAPAAAAPRLMPVAAPAGPLSSEAAAALKSGEGNASVHFGHASLLDERQITAWFFVPEAIAVSQPRIAATLSDSESGAEVARVSLDVRPTTEFFASEGGRTYGVRIPMPPAGAYRAAVALLDGSRNVATGSIPRLVVEAPENGGFQISNLVISGGVDAVSSQDAAFSWGDVQIMPRADGTFRFSESLWYFVQVANPAAADKLVLDVRLRRDNVPHGDPIRIAADAGKIGEGLYLVGRELPLLSLEPGNYSLYVKVIDGTAEKVARADFKVLGPQ